MKNVSILFILLTIALFSNAQKKNDWSFLSETERIVKTLASDEWAGRKPFTEGIDKAAAFIADEFKKAGLQPWNGKSYLQTIPISVINFLGASGKVNGEQLKEQNILAITERDYLQLNDQSTNFQKVYIGRTDTPQVKLNEILSSQKTNLLIIIDTIHRKIFNRAKNVYKSTSTAMPLYNILPYENVFLLTERDPATFSIEYKQQIIPAKLRNVIGVLPGKRQKDEHIVFSAHYDHLGIYAPNEAGDSIYNGANDDASGVAAIIQLARHYSLNNQNERTLIFAAFTDEEMSGEGANYFVDHMDSSSIIANFNIEEIGTVAEQGPGTAMITGYEYSDFGKILLKNLEGTPYQFLLDPYKEMNQFFRSDNITLAKKGIPAHTIITARGDNEPYYHTPDDEWDKLDYKNMNEVIKAIAASATSIISGKDTPSRIDPAKLRR